VWHQKCGTADVTGNGVMEDVRHESNSGTWWKQIEEDYLSPGCIPLVLKLFWDKTSTGTNRSRHPLVLTLGNFILRIQNQHRAKSIVCYLPAGKGSGASDAAMTKVRRRIYHECLVVLFEELKTRNLRKITIILYGKLQTLQIFVQDLYLDGSEARDAAAIHSACISCLLPRSRFAERRLQYINDADSDARTEESMKEGYTINLPMSHCPTSLYNVGIVSMSDNGTSPNQCWYFHWFKANYNSSRPIREKEVRQSKRCAPK
jgi:hypothetical protein